MDFLPTRRLPVRFQTEIVHPGHTPDHHQRLAPTTVYQSSSGLCVFRHQKSFRLGASQPTTAVASRHWHNGPTPSVVCELPQWQTPMCSPRRLISTSLLRSTARLNPQPSTIHHLHKLYLRSHPHPRFQTSLLRR